MAKIPVTILPACMQQPQPQAATLLWCFAHSMDNSLQDFLLQGILCLAWMIHSQYLLPRMIRLLCYDNAKMKRSNAVEMYCYNICNNIQQSLKLFQASSSDSSLQSCSILICRTIYIANNDCPCTLTEIQTDTGNQGHREGANAQGSRRLCMGQGILY